MNTFSPDLSFAADTVYRNCLEAFPKLHGETDSINPTSSELDIPGSKADHTDTVWSGSDNYSNWEGGITIFTNVTTGS